MASSASPLERLQIAQQVAGIGRIQWNGVFETIPEQPQMRLPARHSPKQYG